MAATGMRMLWMHRRSFRKLIVQNFPVLFNTTNRTAMDYRAQACLPCFKKNSCIPDMPNE